MSFLAPKNPVDSAKLEMIKQIAVCVSTRFAKNYLSSLKDELIAQAEKKKAKEIAERLRRERRSGASRDPTKGGPQPRRPRKKGTKKPDKLCAKVTTWETLDSDIDPYVVYVIISSYDGREATKNRRYKDFKLLNKKLGKKVPSGAKIPPANSLFGVRNLHTAFLHDRKTSLSQYLKCLCDVEALATEVEFLKFLGLVKPEDPLSAVVFENAIDRTKWDLWIWKKIVWDEDGQAIAKLVVEDIRQEIWYDIVQACPPSEAARRTALKVAYRTICLTVTPVINAAWNTVSEQAKPVRHKVTEVLQGMFEKLVEVKTDIKAKLKAGMAAALAPVIQIIQKVLGNILSRLLPPLIEGLQPAVEKAVIISSMVSQAIETGDIAKCKDVRDVVHDTKKAVYKKAEEALQKSLENLVGECSKDISHDALKTLLSPFSKIFDILNSLITLIDPETYMDVVIFLIKQKGVILTMQDPTNTASVQEKLDWEESDAMWHARWNGYQIRNAGRELWWDLSTLLADLGPVADVFWSLACSIQSRIHKRLNNPADTRPWAVKVNDSFLLGYHKALKCAKKNLIGIASEYAVEFVKKPILGPLEKEFIPKLKEVIDPIESLIPEPIREILDVGGLVIQSITESISEAITSIVTSQGPLCSTEFLKLGIVLSSTASLNPPTPGGLSSATNQTPPNANTTPNPVPPLATTHTMNVQPETTTVTVQHQQPHTEQSQTAAPGPGVQTTTLTQQSTHPQSGLQSSPTNSGSEQPANQHPGQNQLSVMQQPGVQQQSLTPQPHSGFQQLQPISQQPGVQPLTPQSSANCAQYPAPQTIQFQGQQSMQYTMPQYAQYNGQLNQYNMYQQPGMPLSFPIQPGALQNTQALPQPSGIPIQNFSPQPGVGVQPGISIPDYKSNLV
ncbi:hypothetical protein Pelo_476 [Pelomyxa schiedti]|nr:hypothetical protein Pelo_476 [Pelomyxa schiedti]